MVLHGDGVIVTLEACANICGLVALGHQMCGGIGVDNSKRKIRRCGALGRRLSFWGRRDLVEHLLFLHPRGHVLREALKLVLGWVRMLFLPSGCRLEGHRSRLRFPSVAHARCCGSQMSGRWWCPSFCNMASGVSDVRVATEFAVVDSSACLLYCLGSFVAMKSELRRQSLGRDNDGPQVVCLVTTLHSSPSQLAIRIKVALTLTRVALLGMDLVASHGLCGVGLVGGCLR